MLSGRSRSIKNSKDPTEFGKILNLPFNPLFSKNNLKINLNSNEVIREKKISIGTSVEHSPLNTSIIKENSKDSSTFYNDIFNRDKSISDPIKEYKMKYKSDNVLGQLGRFNDEIENLNQGISIDDFDVVKELGSGKFGKVLQVKRKINGDEFAVKLIPIKNKLNKNDEENLNSESEIFKTISDKYVVKAYYW